MELVALVKHDCPVCDQVLPALDQARGNGASIRILSQSSAEDTALQASRLKLASIPELDADLALSARFDPDAVPAVVLLDGDTERDRVEGLARARLSELAAQARVDRARACLRARRP